jgi:sporulation protein YlmC with PRC-barrel domain
MRKPFLLLFLSLVLFAAGCQAEEPELAFTPETPLPQLTPGFEEATPTPEQTLTPTPDLGTPAATPSPEPTPTPAASPTPEVRELDDDAYLASNLLGTEVLSRQETVLGEIRDFIANREESKVSYALLTLTDSGINGERAAVVPYEALAFEVQSNSSYVYYLEIEQPILQDAPMIDMEEVDFTDPEWDRELVFFWQQVGVIDKDEQDADPTPTFLTPTPGAAAPGAGRTGPQGWVQSRFVLMSVLLEAPVTSLVAAPSPDPTPVRTPSPAPPVQPVTPPPGASPTPNPTETPAGPGATPTLGQVTPTPGEGTPTPGVGTPTPGPIITETPTHTPGQPGETPTPTPDVTPTPQPASRSFYIAYSNPDILVQAATPTPGGGGGIVVTPVPVREVGEVLGIVDDVIMDPENGEILYVLVISQEQWVPVPLEAFTVIHRVGRFALEASPVLRIDRAQLTGAPRYELGQLPELTNEDWDAGIREYWNIE